MKPAVLTLFLFVVIGLAKEKLGRLTYVAMGIVIVTYVIYAYHAAGAS